MLFIILLLCIILSYTVYVLVFLDSNSKNISNSMTDDVNVLFNDNVKIDSEIL